MGPELEASWFGAFSPNASGPPPDRAHDRQKRTPVPADAPFLRALGVTNEQGKPRPGRAAKLRQIQKFVETLTALLKKSGLTAAPAAGGRSSTSTKASSRYRAARACTGPSMLGLG